MIQVLRETAELRAEHQVMKDQLAEILQLQRALLAGTGTGPATAKGAQTKPDPGSPWPRARWNRGTGNRVGNASTSRGAADVEPAVV